MILLILRRWWPFVLGVALGLVVWAALNARRPDPNAAAAFPAGVDSALVAERARAVVLDSVLAAERARRDSVEVDQRARELRVAVLVREAATWERAAHQLADSARVLGDTLGLAWVTAEAWRLRGDSLTVALVVSDSARRTAELDVRRLWPLTDSVDAQRRQLLVLTRDLRETIGRLSRQPTRDWTLGVTVGGGCTVAVSGTGGACGPTVSLGISRRIL